MRQWTGSLLVQANGPLARYVKLRVAHAPGMPGTFSPPPWINDPGMHHGTCVTHVPWCMPGSLVSGFLWSRLRGKRSRHSRRMRNPHFTYLVRGPWPVRLLDAEPLPEPKLIYQFVWSRGINSIKWMKNQTSWFKKRNVRCFADGIFICKWKCHLQSTGHFFSASMCW